MNTIKPFITEDERIKNHSEQCKKYRELNKSIINELFKEKSICLCGGCYTYSHKQQHFRTKIHQCYLAQIKETLFSNNYKLI
jgi:hypothetical protein